jgi:hypothetical protein
MFVKASLSRTVARYEHLCCLGRSGRIIAITASQYLVSHFRGMKALSRVPWGNLLSSVCRNPVSPLQHHAAHFGTFAAGESAENFLSQLVDYERQGVPALAGTRNSDVLDLRRMKRLLAKLDNPQDSWPVVHIAGTKGRAWGTSQQLCMLLKPSCIQHICIILVETFTAFKLLQRTPVRLCTRSTMLK